MAHVDPTHLMELALGNGVTPDDGTLRHLAGCGHCREELRRTLRVVVAARGVRERDLPSEPPERVWRAVARNLSATDRPLTPPPPPAPASLAPASPAPASPARMSPGASRWAARRGTACRAACRRLLSALAAVTRRLRG
ncbi:hypothetical protein [Streptomyces abyssomicinicus]|uniref:hypothetical protein n=1 Tax=Streptomyces abyssomicinicus TaxID=574929 RepID=UPI001250A303|nr:hypothetical protein [Streptomyces abyssomicinicus]